MTLPGSPPRERHERSGLCQPWVSGDSAYPEGQLCRVLSARGRYARLCGAATRKPGESLRAALAVLRGCGSVGAGVVSRPCLVACDGARVW